MPLNKCTADTHAGARARFRKKRTELEKRAQDNRTQLQNTELENQTLRRKVSALEGRVQFFVSAFHDKLTSFKNELVFYEKQSEAHKFILTCQEDFLGWGISALHRGWKPSENYWIGFASRDNTPTGHVMVCLAERDAMKGEWSNVGIYGFYPTDESKLARIEAIWSTPGSVKFEPPESLAAVDKVFLVGVDKAKYEYISSNIFALIQTETMKFGVASKNCVKFIDDIARALGLMTPLSPKWIFPTDYMETLRNLNIG